MTACIAVRCKILTVVEVISHLIVIGDPGKEASSPQGPTFESFKMAKCSKKNNGKQCQGHSNLGKECRIRMKPLCKFGQFVTNGNELWKRRMRSQAKRMTSGIKGKA